MLERLIRQAYQRAVEEQDRYTPSARASSTALDYEPGTDLKFSIDFDVQPQIQLNRLGWLCRSSAAAHRGRRIEQVART